jgi:hypothetical protein
MTETAIILQATKSKESKKAANLQDTAKFTYIFHPLGTNLKHDSMQKDHFNRSLVPPKPCKQTISHHSSRIRF